MSLRAYIRLALIAAAVSSTYAGNISKRSEDQEKDIDIKCNITADGIRYTIERCNKTNKTILKVSVEDTYKVVIPTSPPVPATTRTTMANDTFEVDTQRESRKQITTTDSSLTDIFFQYSQYEDASAFGYFSEEYKDVVEDEKRRHEVHYEGPLHVAVDLHAFCEEAAREDEEVFQVTDGSFHPKYEVIPGVGVYRFHATPMAWEDARSTCEREGGTIAVVNSRAEALALKELHNRCTRILPTHFNDYQYLGVHDLYGEGDWETIKGDSLNNTGYVKWALGQPDNAHHLGENCLTMNRDGFFNDVPCWTKLPFTCEHA